MKEEDAIRRKCGTENPFTVPEGYFEDFTQKLMEQLPEQELPVSTPAKVTMWQRVKPWIYLAAMFGGLMFGFKYLVGNTGSVATTSVAESEEAVYSDEFIEAVIDNSMMDDYTIYCYLTEADNDIYQE